MRKRNDTSSSSEEQSSESESNKESSSSSSNKEEITHRDDADDSQEDYTLPKNSQNRVGRWTHHEISNLKLAMAIFGDQSWKRIQQFLIQKEKESKKSKTIKKAEYTYRSVKAIQSKIYQIKPRVETELDLIKQSFIATGPHKFAPRVIKEELKTPKQSHDYDSLKQGSAEE